MGTAVCGMTNVILALAFAKWGGWGAAGVAAAAAITWTAKNVGFLSVYTAVLMKRRWWVFYSPLLAGGLCTFGIGLISAYVSWLWRPESWLALGTLASAIGLVFAAFAYFVCLLELLGSNVAVESA